jgi:O-antigen/teichoic acid export membrane protein
VSKNHPIRTFLYQFIKAVLAALSVILISRWMGAAGRGEIGLWLFYVNLIMILNEYIGGSSLANLAANVSLRNLLPVAWLWALVSCVIGGIGLYIWLGDFTVVTYVLAMSFPLAFLTIHYNIYQGRSLVNRRNILQVLLELLKLFFVLALGINMVLFGPDGSGTRLTDTVEILKSSDVSLVYAIATVIVLVITIVIWVPKIALAAPNYCFQKPPMELLTYGFWAQNGQLVQFLNYRLSLVWLTMLLGNTIAAGVYSNAMVIADSIWIFANSFAVIAHMRILQSQNLAFRADLTLRYAIIAIGGTGIAVMAFVFVPQSWFLGVFGPGFMDLKQTVIWLIPGIMALGASTLFSHYLHAIGHFKTLFLANLSGLVLQTGLAFLLIPTMGLQGACFAADAGFVLIFIVVFWIFKRQNPDVHLQGVLKWRSLLKVLFRN